MVLTQSPRSPGSSGQTKRPRAGLVIGAVVVVGLLIAGLVMVFGGNPDPKPGTTPDRDPASTGSSVCGLPDGDQEVPDVGPKAEWVGVEGTAIPRSESLGPGLVDGEVGSCFAQNPSGALLAVANFLGDMAKNEASTDELLKRVYEDSNKPLAVEALEGRTSGAQTFGLQIDGFRINDYTSKRANLELAFRATEGPNAGKRAATAFTVAWSDGDWKIVTPPGGQYPTTPITSLAGYTEWGS